MTRGDRLASAARLFLGTPFKLHGRQPGIGLDCVGLLLASLDAIGIKAEGPKGYALRNRSVTHWFAAASKAGLIEVTAPVEPGDVLLITTGPSQVHVLIAENEAKTIHAHAGLGRVVSEPLPPDAMVTMHWRLAA
jgi:hypothetical protein